MEIIFNCPHCNQELSVDGEGAGTEIDCPTCGEKITIPQQPSVRVAPPPSSPPASEKNANPIAASAAAKVEKRLKVPLRETPTEMLIKKSAVPLEAVAKGADKRIRIHTIRHASCIESGHDKFDEVVAKFLAEVGEANLIGIHTVSYSHIDTGSQKLLNDYGVLVVYRG
jgi:DNA-directed RNA polymerase subunit RPC12/RpoP